MYKNFNITEEEKQQIMEMHKSHGYKQPINEASNIPAASPNWDNVVNYLKTNKFPPNYTSKFELDISSDGSTYSVDVFDSQGKKITFFSYGEVFANKIAGGNWVANLGPWTWDGTKPVIQSMDITNPTKSAAGYAQNEDDILKNNKIVGVGSKNDLVKRIQESLYLEYWDEIDANTLPNPGCSISADERLICDGIFGQKTKQLVLKFQEDNGLKKDGYVGNETYRGITGI